MGSADDFIAAARIGADAISMADVLHYGRMTIPEIRAAANAAGLPVRLT
jgi:cyclase